MAWKSLVLGKYLVPRSSCARGETIAEYERAFAAIVGADHGVGFWKGRVAFFAALKALGIGQGDEIIMPAYTCMVIPAAATFLGAVPVYVDIEPTYCTLDPDKLLPAVGPRTKAIMIQHTYGYPSAALERVVDLARSKGLPIVEDCCHALGTRQGGRHVGTFGVAGFFSTQWSKPFTTGLGGLLVCNDGEFHNRVCKVRDAEATSPSPKAAVQLALQGIIHETLVYPGTIAIARNAYRWLTRRGIIAGSTARTEYCGWQPGYFQRMCSVQAAAGLCELDRVNDALRHRRRLTEFYGEALPEIGWSLPTPPSDSEVALLRVPVRVANKEEALKAADAHRVEIGDWFIRPLHSHMAPQEDFGYVSGMCPQADKAAREIINLPTHMRVTLDHARRVIRFLREVCRPA